jgi:hypothetical protein
MKKTTLVAYLALSIVGCSQFPTRYDRIEPNKLRSMGFELGPQAEGAPGDTIHVRAFFGGEPVTAVSWQFSYDHIMNIYGTNAIINIRPLAVFNVSDGLPDSIDISFVIPDSTFFLTKAIQPEILSTIMPHLPAGMQSMTQGDLAAFLKDLGSVDKNGMASLTAFGVKWGPAMGIAALTPSSLDTVMGIAGILVGAFSINGELYANATSTEGTRLKIKGEFTIRYNSRFKATPLAAMLPVNRNPALRWIGVYKVKDSSRGSSGFGEGPAFTQNDSLAYLYNEFMPWKVRNTVLIEKGYSYYLATDSGTVSFSLKAGDSIFMDGNKQTFSSDTTLSGESMLDYRVVTYGNTGKSVIDTETYSYDWEYQNMALDGVTQPLDSLFVIAGGGNGHGPAIVRFLPSLDHKMTRARIWVTASDNLLGELNRPVGQTIRTVDLYFKYAD